MCSFKNKTKIINDSSQRYFQIEILIIVKCDNFLILQKKVFVYIKINIQFDIKNAALAWCVLRKRLDCTLLNIHSFLVLFHLQ